jgi:hypothetical protein
MSQELVRGGSINPSGVKITFTQCLDFIVECNGRTGRGDTLNDAWNDLIANDAGLRQFAKGRGLVFDHVSDDGSIVYLRVARRDGARRWWEFWKPIPKGNKY